jgi:hypothetical protein
MVWVAAAGILEIGAITAVTACMADVLQQPITSNDECLSANEVHCVDDHNNRRQQRTAKLITCDRV